MSYITDFLNDIQENSTLTYSLSLRTNLLEKVKADNAPRVYAPAVAIFEMTMMPSIVLMEGTCRGFISLAERVFSFVTGNNCTTETPLHIAMDTFKFYVTCPLVCSLLADHWLCTKFLNA
jgi:hypothetical protein